MRRLMPVLFLAFFVIGSSAFAQEKKVRYSLGGGVATIWTPEQIDHLYNDGFQVTIGAGYPFTSKLTLGGRLNYNSFGLNKVRLLRSISEFINPSTIADGGTITLWELIGEATYHLFPSEKGFNIYLLGAAGLNVGLISDIGVLVPGQSASITEGTTDADFMASAGLGTRFKIARNVSIFLEGRVSRLLGRGDNLLYTPLRAGFIF